MALHLVPADAGFGRRRRVTVKRERRVRRGDREKRAMVGFLLSLGLVFSGL